MTSTRRWRQHVNYHAVLIDTLTILLRHCDLQGMVTHCDEIAQHIGNKLAEELLVDRLFAEYLFETED
jgi:hypothetical protein